MILLCKSGSKARVYKQKVDRIIIPDYTQKLMVLAQKGHNALILPQQSIENHSGKCERDMIEFGGGIYLIVSPTLEQLFNPTDCGGRFASSNVLGSGGQAPVPVVNL